MDCRLTGDRATLQGDLAMDYATGGRRVSNDSNKG